MADHNRLRFRAHDYSPHLFDESNKIIVKNLQGCFLLQKVAIIRAIYNTLDKLSGRHGFLAKNEYSGKVN